ncbi:MAG: hypothetical protein NT049_03620 [Planctomycetota bacterium]|nr:hypothetical protein [Planctomycetota bacterium]
MRFYGDPVEAPKSRNLRWRWILLGLLAAILLVGAVGTVLVKWTPDFYSRTAGVVPTAANRARFDAEIINKIGNVLLDKSGKTDLDLTVTEEMVNIGVAGFVEDQQKAGKSVSAAIQALRVSFEPDTIIVASIVGNGATSVVAAQHLGVEVQKDGTLLVSPSGASAGVLPVPDTLVAEARQTLASRLAGKKKKPEEEEGALDLTQCSMDALEGKPVTLGSGRRYIAVDKVQIEKGLLRIWGHLAEKPKGGEKPPAAATDKPPA